MAHAPLAPRRQGPLRSGSLEGGGEGQAVGGVGFPSQPLGALGNLGARATVVNGADGRRLLSGCSAQQGGFCRKSGCFGRRWPQVEPATKLPAQEEAR
jgi:hypothetical protein